MNKCLDLVVGENPTRLMGISFSLEQLKLGNDGILTVLEDVIANNSFIMEQLDNIVNSAQNLELGLFTLTDALTNPSSVLGNLSYKKLGLFVNIMHTTTKYRKSLTQLILLLHDSGVDLDQSDIILVDNIAYPGIYTDYRGFKIILDSNSMNDPETVLLSLLFAYHTHQLNIKNPTVMGILNGFIEKTKGTKLEQLTDRRPRETDKTYYNRILSILFSNDVNLTNVETMEEFIDPFIKLLNGIASEEIKELTDEEFLFTGEIRYSTNKKLNDLAFGYYNLFLKYEYKDNTLISTVGVDEFVNKLSEYIGIANYTNNEVRNVILKIETKDPTLLGLLYDNINLFKIDTFHRLVGETGDLYLLLKKRVGVSGKIGKVPEALNTLTNRVVNEVVTTLDIGTLVFRFVTLEDDTNTKYFEIAFADLKDLTYKLENDGKKIVINSRLEDKTAYDEINKIIQRGGKNVKIYLPSAYLNDEFIKNNLSNLDVTNKSVSVTNVISRMVPKMYNLASALFVDELTVFTNEVVVRKIKNTDYSHMRRISKESNLYTIRYFLPLGTKIGNGNLVNKIVKLTNLNSSLMEASKNALEKGTILRDVEGLEGLLIVIQNDRNDSIKVFNLKDGKFYDLTENQVSTIKKKFNGVEGLSKLKDISKKLNTFKFVLSSYSYIEFKFDGKEWKTNGMINKKSTPFTHSVITEFDMSNGAKRNLLKQNRHYIENVNDSLYLVLAKLEDSDISNSDVTPQLDPAYRFNRIKELFANAGITDFPRYTVEELNSIEYDSSIYNLSRGVYITNNMKFVVPEDLNNLVEGSEEYENALRNIESRLYTTWAMKVDTDTFNDNTTGTTSEEKFELFNKSVLTGKIEKKGEGLQTLFGIGQSMENFMLLDNYENNSTINPFGNSFLRVTLEANIAKHLELAELKLLCE